MHPFGVYASVSMLNKKVVYPTRRGYFALGQPQTDRGEKRGLKISISVGHPLWIPPCLLTYSGDTIG